MSTNDTRDVVVNPLENTLENIQKYFLVHLGCILEGFAILFDADGMWCSQCERPQFDIGVEEQDG